jgi:K+ transporter
MLTINILFIIVLSLLICAIVYISYIITSFFIAEKLLIDNLSKDKIFIDSFINDLNKKDRGEIDSREFFLTMLEATEYIERAYVNKMYLRYRKLLKEVLFQDSIKGRENYLCSLIIKANNKKENQNESKS